MHTVRDRKSVRFVTESLCSWVSATHYKSDGILQKRLINLRSLLIVATPYSFRDRKSVYLSVATHNYTIFELHYIWTLYSTCIRSVAKRGSWQKVCGAVCPRHATAPYSACIRFKSEILCRCVTMAHKGTMVDVHTVRGWDFVYFLSMTYKCTEIDVHTVRGRNFVLLCVHDIQEYCIQIFSMHLVRGRRFVQLCVCDTQLWHIYDSPHILMHKTINQSKSSWIHRRLLVIILMR